MIVNNMDRVPFIWNNSGNAANLIFEVKLNPKMTSADLLEPYNCAHDFEYLYSIDASTVSVNR
jgi:hypothetical protein